MRQKKKQEKKANKKLKQNKTKQIKKHICRLSQTINWTFAGKNPGIKKESQLYQNFHHYKNQRERSNQQ